MGLSLVSLTFLLCTLSVFFPLFIEAANTIKQGEFLRDGETLVSSGEAYELGFFSPKNSNLRYVGTWYKKVSVQTVVWIANRNSPVSDRNGSFTIGSNGDLAVLDQTGALLWSSNVSTISGNSTATLTETGNLVLSSSSDNSEPLWQSFQNPTDSFLPGMVLHLNASNGENHLLRPWKSDSDPTVGNYSTGIDTRGTPQVVTWLGPKRIWRSGHWSGLVFLGVPSMRSFHLDGFRFDKEQDGSLDVTYTAFSNETMRFYLLWNGSIAQQIWNETVKVWRLIQIHPANQCEEYNKCGPFGVCTGEDSASCGCIQGFHPKNSDEWNRRDWSGGCVRKNPKLCEGDGFKTMEKVKLPDFATVLPEANKADCEQKCLKNCSCNAYAFVTGIQCMMWSSDLVDVQHFADIGETLYLRLNRADLAGKMKLSTGAIIGIAVAAAVIFVVLIGLLWWFWGRLKGLLNPKHKGKKVPPLNPYGSTELSKEMSGQEELGIDGKPGSGSDLPMYSFSTIAAATNDFANENKLGQGGFGPVYKGTLPGGQEVAVKRLSRLSGQGLEEFKNEIILIAKLQHRNLVRLLGCSIEGEEKLLIYEYMPNKSLDFLLFDHNKEEHLDWKTRNSIIEGVARGLLYLHRDSRLRIIHRDMKASNILLDEEMNPKISDFGMARMFGGNDNEANTVRVVGTYGYMAPEYAMEGLFSVKSDVYSFGVLLLEIVSGRKNASFRTNEFSSLIRYSWNLWLEGKTMELVDPAIADSCNKKEVLRCIHVAMLCVQDSAMNRPTMSSVVLMLESEVSTLPVPKQPTFSSLSNMVHVDLGLDGDDTTSMSNVTITQAVGR